MDKYLFIGATVALTIYAQVMMKWRSLSHASSVPGRKIEYLFAMFTDLGVLSVFAAAAAASVVWSLAIERTPLTVAYPFMALSFALVPLVSVVLFREGLSVLQLFGIFLIVVGVALSSATN